MSNFRWGVDSKTKLSNAHYVLQKLADKALEISKQDLKVICSYRNEHDQNKAFDEGTSKLKWPKSKHNCHPSEAIDVVPLPLDWNNIEPFEEMVQVFEEAWYLLDEDITKDWVLQVGADFSFKDYPHFQIVRKHIND
jgi:peptidoglycan L-alanyl-D-glutamate endopeptidase CwlK